MPFSNAGKNRMLDAWGGTATGNPVTHVSLHTAIPNDSGSNEVAGGAYARKAVGWSAAASGVLDKNATDPVFDVPASTTVVAFGFWTAITAGTFMGWSPLNGGGLDGVGVAAASTDVITSYGHGLANNDRVFLQTVAGESLPTGLNDTTLYWVVSATTDTFQLSATQGGSAINITADGELFFQRLIPEVFASAGTLTLDTASFNLNG